MENQSKQTPPDGRKQRKARHERRKTIVEDSGCGEHRPNEPRNHRSAGERRPIPEAAQNGRVRPLAADRYRGVDTNTLSGLAALGWLATRCVSTARLSRSRLRARKRSGWPPGAAC